MHAVQSCHNERAGCSLMLQQGALLKRVSITAFITPFHSLTSQMQIVVDQAAAKSSNQRRKWLHTLHTA